MAEIIPCASGFKCGECEMIFDLYDVAVDHIKRIHHQCIHCNPRPKTEISWLIEISDTNMRGELMLDYWAAPGATPDAMQAVRFSRKADGEIVLKWLLSHGPLCSPAGTLAVREHMFYGA